MLDNEPFNQTRSYLTWREDNILPYDGVYGFCKLQFGNLHLAICRNLRYNILRNV